MAWGFTPKYSEDYRIEVFTEDVFIAKLYECIEALGWKIQYVSKSGIIAYTDNGMFSINGSVTTLIKDGIANIKSESVGTEMFDMGKNKKFVKELIEELETHNFTIEQLEERIEFIKEKFPDTEEDHLAREPETTSEKMQGFLSLFIPKKGFYITPILMDINIIVFILMAISGVNILAPEGESLLNWGANFRPYTLDGEPWRLFTACFIHIGIIHLLMNMYALLYIGVLLEPILGRTYYLTAYILSGIIASAVSLWWHDFTVSAGASGAIFGMYGVFLALLSTNIIDKEQRKSLLSSIGIFVVYNLVYGFKDGIDNAAHIGGLLSGAIIGYALLPGLKKRNEKRIAIITTVSLIIVTLILTSFIFANTNNDLNIYQQNIDAFVEKEEEALSIYEIEETNNNKHFLNEIKTTGIENWEKCIGILEQNAQLELPVHLKTQNSRLKRYCNLRIELYNAIYKKYAEDTYAYDSEIEELNKQIEELIEDM